MTATYINTVKANAGIVAKMMAGELVDNLQFCKSISQADPSDYKGKNGFGAGDTVYIAKPARPVVGSSFDITSTVGSIAEEKVALPLDIVATSSFDLDSSELASSVDYTSIYERFVKPYAKGMAQNIESTFLTRAMYNTANTVGTPGSTTFDTDLVLQAGQKMQEFCAPMDGDRFALLSPAAQRSALVARKGFVQASEQLAKQYKDGIMGRADGFTYLSNNLLPRLTLGADVTGIAVEASVQAISNGMSSIGLDGVTSGATIKAGSVFTIAGVNAVHPQTKVDLGYLQQFVVTADVTETAGNSVIAQISPAIYYTTTDSRQNVSAAPVDEAALVFVGSASTTYTNNIAFHKDAFRMVSVPLVLPEKAEYAAQYTYKGITVAIVRDWDQLKRRMITRVDFLGGFAPVRPEWACKMIG